MTKLKQNLGAGHCSTNGCQRSHRGVFCMCVCVPVCVCACMYVCDRMLFFIVFIYFWFYLVTQLVKKLPAMRETWRRERLPTPAFWPGEFHRLYSPWGCKESDTTEQLPHSLLYISTQISILADLF